MAPTKDMIERMFDAAAPTYDLTGPSVFGRFGARLAELVSVPPGARVLDVATGAGAALLPVARRLGPGARVTGVDLSAEMLQRAEQAARAEGLTNVELRKMDAENLGFPDETFDVVLCANAIFLFPDKSAALREMYRVTKPGGRLGVSIFGNTPPAFMPAWAMLAEQLRDYEVTVPMPNPLFHYLPEEMEGLLLGTGFRSAETHSEAGEVIYGDGEDWWNFLLTMAPRPALMSLDEATRARFKAEYLGRLQRLFHGDGMHLELSMLYGVGLR